MTLDSIGRDAWRKVGLAARKASLASAIPVALFLAATPALADRLIIPGIARSHGAAGTFFVTDGFFANLGTLPASVGVSFIPASGEGPALSNFVIDPGSTLQQVDLVGALFGLDEVAGMLIIDSDQPLAVRARSYNAAAPEGSYGAALPVVPSHRIQSSGIWHAIWVSDRRDSYGFRTNVGLGFPEDGGGKGTLTLKDEVGRELGSRSFESQTASFLQIPVGDLAPNRDELPRARLELSVDRGSVVGYTSVVDNVTGDASVFPFEPFPAGEWEVDVSGIARAAGAHGTWWRSDVRLFNPGDSPVSIDVTFLPRQTTNASPAKVSIVLAPSELREVIDVLGSLFGAPDGSVGALDLRSGSSFLVAGRTSNIDPSGARPGSFGAKLSAVPLLSFSSSLDEGVTLPGAAPAAGFRTNLAIRAGPGGFVGSAALRSPDGTIGASYPIVLGSNGASQSPLEELFPDIAIPPGASIDLRVQEGAVSAYAAIVDNESGDSIVAPASGLPCQTHKPMAVVSGDTTICKDGKAEIHVALIGSRPWNLFWSDGAVELTDDPAEDRTVKPKGTTTYFLMGLEDHCARLGSPVGSATITVADCQ